MFSRKPKATSPSSSATVDRAPAGQQSLLPCYREVLLEVARRSIREGLEGHGPLAIRARDFSPPLREERATFVTLEIGGALRGCTGTLEARHPLIVDVANNAYRSAFEDPRFSPLDSSEFEQIDLRISVLSALEPLPCGSEAELIKNLRPGKDGLVLREGAHGATFLPQVWNNLADPCRFLGELKLKAGLPADYWSDGLRFWRYSVEEIS